MEAAQGVVVRAGTATAALVVDFYTSPTANFTLRNTEYPSLLMLECRPGYMPDAPADFVSTVNADDLRALATMFADAADQVERAEGKMPQRKPLPALSPVDEADLVEHAR